VRAKRSEQRGVFVRRAGWGDSVEAIDKRSKRSSDGRIGKIGEPTGLLLIGVRVILRNAAYQSSWSFRLPQFMRYSMAFRRYLLEIRTRAVRIHALRANECWPLCRLRLRFGKAQCPEPVAGDRRRLIPRIGARQIDVLPSQRWDVLEQMVWNVTSTPTDVHNGPAEIDRVPRHNDRSLNRIGWPPLPQASRLLEAFSRGFT